MIALLTCCFALSTSQQDGHLFTKVDLQVPPNSSAKLYIQSTADPLDPPQLSPKRFGSNQIQWEFPWLVAGYSHPITAKTYDDLRFYVFAQEQKGNRATGVAQMLLRLWHFNYDRLKLVHNPIFQSGRIDVYLCFGGQAGGEQLLGEVIPPNGAKPFKVNTIYIYDLPSFTDPVEMAREVAHEYGHATWPHFGGFTQPEEWAEGYLSEKVFLQWLRNAMARNELTSDDALGATKAGLDKWIAANVDPLIVAGAQVLPTSERLADPSATGMNAFLGLALYINAIYPDSVFARSLKMSGSYLAKDYPAGVVLAAEEPDEVSLKIPTQLIGKAIWIPLGSGKLRGAAIIKKDPSGWVQIQVGASPIVVANTH